MTPAEKAALEALVGYELNAEQVVQIDQYLPARNDVEIAKILSTDRKQLYPRKIGIGTILSVLAPTGGAFLNAMQAKGAMDPNVFWAMELLRQGEFDIGSAAAQIQIGALANATPDLANQLNVIRQLGFLPDPLDFNKVSDALNVAQGLETL